MDLEADRGHLTRLMTDMYGLCSYDEIIDKHAKRQDMKSLVEI